MSEHDRIGAWEVAFDMLELGREADARALLDEEFPDRLTIPCAACGQPIGYACQEQMLRECPFCAGKGERFTVTFPNPDPTTHYRPEPKREMLRCRDCYGTGQREKPVDLVLPHQSRILGIARRY